MARLRFRMQEFRPTKPPTTSIMGRRGHNDNIRPVWTLIRTQERVGGVSIGGEHYPLVTPREAFSRASIVCNWRKSRRCHFWSTKIFADFEAFRLFHVNFLRQFSGKKRCDDIPLINFQTVVGCNYKENSHHCHLYHWCTSVEVVDPINLCESPSNQPCF